GLARHHNPRPVAVFVSIHLRIEPQIPLPLIPIRPVASVTVVRENLADVAIKRDRLRGGCHKTGRDPACKRDVKLYPTKMIQHFDSPRNGGESGGGGNRLYLNRG